MRVGELGWQGLLHRLDVRPEILDVLAAVARQLTLQAPAPEHQQPGLEVLRGHRLEAALEVALEDVGPEMCLLCGQAFELEATPGTEIVVGDELVRQVCRLLLPGAGQRLGPDDVVLLVDLLLLEHHLEQHDLKGVAELFRFGFRATTLDHLLPVFQEGIERRRLGKKADPAIEQLVIELLFVDDPRQGFLGLAGDRPAGQHVLRRAQGERFRELTALGLKKIGEQLLLLLDLLLGGLELVDHRLGRERVLVVRRVRKHTGERVVVLREDRVVLVIVTASARDREAQETPRDGVHSIVTFVGARDLDRAIVVVPRAEAQEAERRKRSHARRLVEQIGRNLGFDELVVGQIVVVRLDDPVAVEPRIRVRRIAAPHGIQTARIVLAVPRNVQPHAPPRLAIPRRRKQPIDDPVEGIRRRVLLERVDLVRRGWQTRQVNRGAADERQLVGGFRGSERLRAPVSKG